MLQSAREVALTLIIFLVQVCLHTSLTGSTAALKPSLPSPVIVWTDISDLGLSHTMVMASSAQLRRAWSLVVAGITVDIASQYSSIGREEGEREGRGRGRERGGGERGGGGEGEGGGRERREGGGEEGNTMTTDTYSVTSLTTTHN